MKTLKVLVGIGLTILAGVAAWKTYKKEYAKIEKAEEKVKSDYSSIGLSKERFDKEIDPEDENGLAKGLFLAARFGNRFDGLGDIIDPNESLEHRNVIHVKSDTNSFTIGFEINRNILKGTSFTEPRIGDYIRAFSEIGTYINDNYIGSQRKPRTELVGYNIISYKRGDSDKEIFKSYRIKPEHYSSWVTDQHDGLTDYIRDVMESPKEWNGNLIIDDIKESNIKDIELADISLIFEITFPIQTLDMPGVNLFNGLEVLRYLATEFEVTRNKSSVAEGIRYDHIMFHTLDNNGDESLLWYYDVNENNEVILCDYIY